MLMPGLTRQRRRAAPATSGEKTLLSQSDFAYEGYFELSKNMGGFGIQNFCTSLTHRYVSGSLEFLFLTNGVQTGIDDNKYDTLLGFPHPGLTGTVTNYSKVWVGSAGHLWGAGSFAGAATRYGTWYQQDTGRLWTVQAIDYPDDEQTLWTKGITARILGSNYSAPSEYKGPWGFSGIGDRNRFGGFQKIPEWFQSAYGVGDLCVGFGGYSSRLTQGYGASLGLALFAFSDPTSGSNDIEIAFHTLANHKNGAVSSYDWYAGNNSSFDRGRRLAGTVNSYFDQPNIASENNFQATYLSNPAGPHNADQWFGTAPDGYARWAWSDTYLGTGIWFDSPTKHGFFSILSGIAGNAGYVTSTFASTAPIVIEAHIFDPYHFGEVMNATRSAHQVQPEVLWDMGADWPQYDWRSYPTTSVYDHPWVANSATFDEATNKLYVMVPAANSNGNARVFQYAVDLGA
jgi:hypothetical protein